MKDETNAQPCEGTDSEDEEQTAEIPFVDLIWVKCADCGYQYNPTDFRQRSRHREYVKKT